MTAHVFGNCKERTLYPMKYAIKILILIILTVLCIVQNVQRH